MKNEIQIFYDKELSKEITSEIEFPPSIAGKESKNSLFIKNNIPFVANLDISLEGDVEIIKNIESIKPEEVEELIILIKPKLTTMKPIKAKLNIKIEYLVE